MTTTPLANAPLPTPPSYPKGRLRTTWEILQDPLECYRAGFERYGDPLCFHSLNGPVVTTAREEGIKQIVKADPKAYEAFGVNALRSLVGASSVLTTSGAVHKRHRKMLMPPFHGGGVKAAVGVVEQVARRRLEEVKGADVFEMGGWAQGVTLEVILRAVFGLEEPAKLEAFADAVHQGVSRIHPVFLFATSLQRAPFGWGPWGRFLRAMDRLDAMLLEQIEAKRADPGQDILSMMLGMQDEEGAGLSVQELRDELVTLVVAGHETTTVALSWAAWHLSQDQEAQERLRQEVSQAASMEEAVAGEWMGAVVQESLRLWPILPDVVRVLGEPMELLGYHVPAGWCVGVATTAVHHDPARWESPMQWEPQRFLDTSKAELTWSFLPFGMGHRRCVGAAFATMEVAAVLAVMVRAGRIESAGGKAPRSVRKNLTMAPSPAVRVRVIR